MKKLSTVTMIVFYLSEHDLSDAPTIGDIGRAIGAPVGTAIGERLREARTVYGWKIKCDVKGEGKNRKFTYWLAPEHRRKAKAMLAKLIAAEQKAA